MRPTQVTIAGIGDSVAIPMDWEPQPYQVGIQVIEDVAPVNYTMQFTFDDPRDPAARWIDSIIVLGTASDVFLSQSPTRGIRLSNADTGTATMAVVRGSRSDR